MGRPGARTDTGGSVAVYLVWLCHKHTDTVAAKSLWPYSSLDRKHLPYDRLHSQWPRSPSQRPTFFRMKVLFACILVYTLGDRTPNRTPLEIGQREFAALVSNGSPQGLFVMTRCEHASGA